jgi:hypothetical protein
MDIPIRGGAVLIEWARYLQFYEKLLSELPEVMIGIERPADIVAMKLHPGGVACL